jgi:SWI/SNF-related matrix-associated actin-dependent regulator of chromatin subfamily A-like protein 1
VRLPARASGALPAGRVVRPAAATPRRRRLRLSCGLVSHAQFTAELARDEAVLRFPYDEGLRRLLRAIPGRRWDPIERAWCVPLGPEQAESLARLFAELPHEPEVSAELGRTIRRRRARRRREQCVVELARPDSNWWLSFATDAAPEPVAALMEHPDARELPAIGRGLVPLDDHAARLLERLGQGGALQLSEPVRRALLERSRRARGEQPASRSSERPSAASAHDVEFRRDRRGEHWLLVGAGHARLARVLAARAGLRALEAPGGAVGLAAAEHDAEQLSELIAHLEDADVDPRVSAWLARARTWRGNIEVQGPSGAPVFLLLGDEKRLPRAIRDRAGTLGGGVALPLTLESWQLIEAHLEGWISHAGRRCVAALREGRAAPPAVLELSGGEGHETFVLAAGHDESLLAGFAALPGVLAPPAQRARRAQGERARLPAVRADPFCVPELDRFLSEHAIWVEPSALARLQEVREQHAAAAGVVELSGARTGTLRVPGLGGELKPFQRAGVSYLLGQRRAFLADEQGLGKTIEALATLEAAGAYPAVVVCPASLKLNWLREIDRWLPARRAAALSGNGGGERAPEAELTVVNYDILAARSEALRLLAPRALVLDESHYCKNAGAKRTQAVQRLAAEIPGDGLVLALTGTPVVNRPAELISQLRILGRLGDFGSGAQFGERFRGADAHLRLHWHLRARCFVRRLKADVLEQLPPKTRAVVPVELDNEAEYRHAERDLIGWLRSQPLDLRELDAKVAAALRAERLVRLNALKVLAARGKLRAALAWMHDFLSSGERLVVFAHHREIQGAVLERFPEALHILGSDSHAARDTALEAFQRPDGEHNQLIVCSIDAAGHGLTLTRSSSVAFLELDWTPAKHDQAEDRCHRIGQQDAVNSYYLLAADTVDETISSLLERKRAVIGAVTDGRPEDEAGVVDALVRELRAAPYRHLRAVA